MWNLHRRCEVYVALRELLLARNKSSLRLIRLTRLLYTSVYLNNHIGIHRKVVNSTCRSYAYHDQS